MFYLLLERCVPYSAEACKTAGSNLGLTLGTSRFRLEGNYSEVGCFAYSTGYFTGSVFYGTGGTIEQMENDLIAPKFRPQGYDCDGEGKK